MTNPLMYQIIDGKRSRPEDLHRGADRPRRHLRRGRRGSPPGLPQPARAGLQRGPRAGEGRRRRRARRSRPSSRSRPELDTRSRCEVVHRIADAARASSPRASPRTRGSSRCWQRRVEMSREGGIDWAFGELLALGSIAMEGRLVRLSGQDTRRGTFVQRHSVLIDRQHRRGVPPAAAPVGRPGAGPDLRLGAVGVRRARLRVRLLGGQPERPGAVGGASSATSSTAPSRSSTSTSPPARPSGASTVRRRAAAPARARGPGPRPHLGPHRAVPAAVRGGLDDRRRCRPSRRTTSTCCAGTCSTASAARWWCSRPKSMLRNKAAVSPLSRLHRRQVPEVIDDPRYRDGDGPADGVTKLAALLRQDLLGAGRRPARSARSPTRRSCGSSSSTRCRTASSPTCSSATRTPPTCAGCRRSRRTRARGRSSAWSCRRSCPSGCPGSSGCRGGAMAAPAPGSSKVHEVEQADILEKALS